MSSTKSLEPLPFEEVDPVERVAAVLYHMAHLPQGAFWPHQLFRTHTEILYSVHLLRSLPEYEAWLQVAEMQMAELGLVPGKPVSSVRSEEERILLIRPVPPNLQAEATERELSSMGDVETWQSRSDRLKEMFGDGLDPQTKVELLAKPVVGPIPQKSIVWENEGKGKGRWKDPRVRKNNKYSWRKRSPTIEAPLQPLDSPEDSHNDTSLPPPNSKPKP